MYCQNRFTGAVTPEAKVKKKIKELLDSFDTRLYYYMPVPSGYGKTTIDYLICFDGLFVGIEAKKPRGKPTLRQEGVLEDIRAAGGSTFVIDDDDDVVMLSKFLNAIITRRKPALKSDLVDVAGEIQGETDKAYRFFDGTHTVWLPKSQCAWDSDDNTMAMPEWLAMEKELI